MALNRTAIYIGPQVDKAEKPIEFTHVLSSDHGWVKTASKSSDYNKIVYLGKCRVDGDMFATYDNSTIGIYKGKLNSGKH